MSDHTIIKAFVAAVHDAIVMIDGDTEMACTKANMAILRCLENDDIVERLGLEYIPDITRVTGVFGDQDHEWVTINEVEYDATVDQVDDDLVNVQHWDDWPVIDEDTSDIEALTLRIIGV